MTPRANRIKQNYSDGGFIFMKTFSIEERAVNLAHYIIDSKDTVRGAAKKFGVSKSTVHTDVSALQKIKFPNILNYRGVLKYCTDKNYACC